MILGKQFDNLIDSVKIKIVQSIEEDKLRPYLEKIACGKQTLNSYEYPILRMSPEELKTC